MNLQTSDLRIQETRHLSPPAVLLNKYPLSEAGARFILKSRLEIAGILAGKDERLLVVAGPCSIHDPVAALDYGRRLRELAELHREALLVVMRVYFEKPRTVVGWKGLINDPGVDGSFAINEGLEMARRLLLELNAQEMPAATEFLDTIIGQFIADLISWGAVGARTTESQIHRDLASGLSMPVGFKNGTDGDVQVAIDAVRAARTPQWFPSITREGVAAILATKGNDWGHIVLRGGSKSGPNYQAAAVGSAVAALKGSGLPPYLMIDCSHGNSCKDHLRQIEVARDIAAQISAGNRNICGVMLESCLVEGRQDYKDKSTARYGQSITDACLSIEQTAGLLKELAAAVMCRRQLS
ncbi:MAG: 3-deoxy-7-phosphoheptulonate synthase [Deltaproteobacteria bacterium]|nr:3-deoxy-7-phosphoheptulonate synthase [Deltaproteobacteria bacterium]